jgi:hypothetical protein
MNVTLIISQLREERTALDEAIAVLERIARSGPRGRGRPPNWMSGAPGDDGSTASPRRVFSAATKKKMAEAQRKRWEAYRKAKEQA